MPKERVSNVKIKEVLRLKFDADLSNRQIGASLCISHSTVADYLHRAEEAGIGWPLPEELSESQLEDLHGGALELLRAGKEVQLVGHITSNIVNQRAQRELARQLKNLLDQAD